MPCHISYSYTARLVSSLHPRPTNPSEHPDLREAMLRRAERERDRKEEEERSNRGGSSWKEGDARINKKQLLQVWACASYGRIVYNIFVTLFLVFVYI